MEPANRQAQAEALGELQALAGHGVGPDQVAGLVGEGRAEVDVGAYRPRGLELETEREAPLQVAGRLGVAEVAARHAAGVERVAEPHLVAELVGHRDRLLGELETLAPMPGEGQKRATWLTTISFSGEAGRP